jgi:serine/threonine protein kinase
VGIVITGHFDIVHLLTKSTFSSIYRAIDHRTNSDVAVKVICQSDDRDGDSEVSILTCLKNCPSIVQFQCHVKWLFQATRTHTAVDAGVPEAHFI